MSKCSNLNELPNKNSRFIVFDTETTGLFRDKNHILEIAALEVENGYLTGNQFHALIKPRKNIEIKAQELHKMNDTYYKENFEGFFVSDRKLLENFLKFIGNSHIFAHNAEFDIQFINHELNFWNLPQIPEEKFRCTMKIFKNLFQNKNFYKEIIGFSLINCCQFFELNFEKNSFHSALYDSALTAKLINSIYLFIEKNPLYILTRKITDLSQFKNKKIYLESINYNNNSHIFLNNNKSKIEQIEKINITFDFIEKNNNFNPKSVSMLNMNNKLPQNILFPNPQKIIINNKNEVNLNYNKNNKSKDYGILMGKNEIKKRDFKFIENSDKIQIDNDSMLIDLDLEFDFENKENLIPHFNNESNLQNESQKISKGKI